MSPNVSKRPPGHVSKRPVLEDFQKRRDVWRRLETCPTPLYFDIWKSQFLLLFLTNETHLFHEVNNRQ